MAMVAPAARDTESLDTRWHDSLRRGVLRTVETACTLAVSTTRC